VLVYFAELCCLHADRTLLAMTHKHGCVYYLRECEKCRIAFIRSFRPSRAKQEGALDYLQRYHKVNRDELLKALKA